MRININDYRVNKDYLERVLRLNPDKNPIKLCAEISMETGVPIIAILHYLGELQGYTDKLINHINEIREFYQYTNVTGTKLGEF